MGGDVGKEMFSFSRNFSKDFIKKARSSSLQM